MVDSVSPERRSQIMARVRAIGSRSEMSVRAAAHSMGLRFRLHRRDLPGSPDLVFPKFRTAIFVHGCFWHRHPGCANTRTPKSNVPFWEAKFAENVARDERVQERLQEMGWKPVVIWECETKKPEVLRKRITELLKPQEPSVTP